MSRSYARQQEDVQHQFHHTKRTYTLKEMTGAERRGKEPTRPVPGPLRLTTGKGTFGDTDIKVEATLDGHKRRTICQGWIRKRNVLPMVQMSKTRETQKKITGKSEKENARKNYK